MNHSVSPPSHKLKEEDDIDQHFVYASFEISDSSYQRKVFIDVTGNDVGSLVQRLKVQEELSK